MPANDAKNPANFIKVDSPDSLAAALSGDSAAFALLTEPYRKELLTHCYRMLGSLEDAEDQVQESLLRAWRRLSTYQSKGSLRAWLYKIATNACLDVIAQRPKRSLPFELYLPANPSHPPEPMVNDQVWIQPYPDELLAPVESSPEAKYESRESISFAFLIALQELPARQRCALILSDVLDWQTAEIAELLDISVTAANSLLHRARSVLKRRYPRKTADRPHLAGEREKQLLESYLRAWETADVEGIVLMLTEQAAFAMPPLPAWYQGREAIRSFLQANHLPGDTAGTWRLLPIHANGRPGFAFYRWDEQSAAYLPFALQVLAFAGEQLAEVITFGGPGLFASFGLDLALGG